MEYKENPVWIDQARYSYTNGYDVTIYYNAWKEDGEVDFETIAIYQNGEDITDTISRKEHITLVNDAIEASLLENNRY